MFNTRSCRSLAAALLCLLAAGAVHADWQVTVNPYETIDWEQHERHHGNFHTHTTESDGSQSPADVIDGYHAIGHGILALTDHDKHTWPWTAFGRDPDELDMLAIRGNELSRHHHTLSLFSDLETSTSDHETAVQEVHDIGGVSVLAHPGRYWDLDEEGQVPDEVRDKYADLFLTYSSLVGMEVVNQGDRYPEDRALWDALLTHLMPDKPVWGMANDDSHGEAHIGLNTTVMLLPERDDEQVRAALENGRYYFTTVTSHPQDEQDRDQTPVIRNVIHDADAGTLTLVADAAGEPLPDERYQWISAGGKVVHEGPTLELNAVDGLDRYVRAEIRGDGGTAYTQPFGIEQHE
ncbi:MAG: hypothetical protein WD534_18835 [Phycisphaeraceae bacterium]